MHTDNAYYTEEYQEYRRSYGYVFQNKYKILEKTILLPDGYHSIIKSTYSDDTFKVRDYLVHTTFAKVFNKQNILVAEIECINNDTLFFELIEHSNGHNYLITRVDLYGYSTLDLSNYDIYHYVPSDSFKGKDETFIWTNVLYCKKNNLMAVDGCYWASTFSTEIFDFTHPEDVPYPRVFNSYDLDGEVNIDSDIMPLRWNEDGTIVLECYTEDETKVEKRFSILYR